MRRSPKEEKPGQFPSLVKNSRILDFITIFEHKIYRCDFLGELNPLKAFRKRGGSAYDGSQAAWRRLCEPLMDLCLSAIDE